MKNNEFDLASIFQGCDIQVEYAEVFNGAIQIPSGVLLTDTEVARLAGAVDGSTVVVTLETMTTIVEDTYVDLTAIVLRTTHPEIFKGTIERHLYMLDDGGVAIMSVFNEAFSLHPEWRQKGIAKRALAHQLDVASSIGVRRIVANAVGNNGSDYTGYIVWPTLGYDGAVPEDIWQRFPEDDVSRLGFQASSPPPISDLYASEDGRALWKQYGEGFPMEIDVQSLNATCLELLATIGVRK